MPVSPRRLVRNLGLYFSSYPYPAILFSFPVHVTSNVVSLTVEECFIVHELFTLTPTFVPLRNETLEGRGGIDAMPTFHRNVSTKLLGWIPATNCGDDGGEGTATPHDR